MATVAALTLSALTFTVKSAIAAPDIQWSGAGWFQYGSIGHSSDTTGERDFTGKSLLGSGALMALNARVSDQLGIQAGIGVNVGHALMGFELANGGYAPMNASPFLANAYFDYAFTRDEESELSLKGGFFPYDYASENRNLGLYLLRGPAYPGIVQSGFETKEVLPVANVFGLQFRHRFGSYQGDLLLTVENEQFPFYDFSPAYVAQYAFGEKLKLGAGANFYHLLPIESKLTSDTSIFYVEEATPGAGGDTTEISFAGTKLMANFAFSPLAGADDDALLGPNDLTVYGEIALNGLDNSSAIQALYGDWKHRMPVMFGIHLPTLRILDVLAFELEWYGAPYLDDMSNFKTTAGPKPSPIPVTTADSNITEDNWKWSLYASRVFAEHIKWSAQVANDHFRPGTFEGYGDNNPPRRESVMQSAKDWYWMTKIAYFF
jgi:hypothetical protein